MKESCICVLADLHINIPHQKALRMKRLAQAISNIAAHEEINALCLLGDISDHGLLLQQNCVIREVKRIVDKQIILALGNHDIFHYLPSTTSIFFDLNRLRGKLSLSPQKEIYQEVWIQDCVFLVLGSEKRLRTDCFFSSAQCAWLQERLECYRALPYVCICNHQPLTNTHSGSGQLGLGGQDRMMKELLRAYTNVVWISAHLHTGVEEPHILQGCYGMLLDIPSFSLPRKKHARCGCGVLLRLSDTYIRYEVWDFLQNTCLLSYCI